MSTTLERIACAIPADFAELEEEEAEADGYQHLARLASEFAQSPGMFHAIFACRLGSVLVGIGAITDEPAWTLQPTWRMRRFYVRRNSRRRKIAFAIASALFQEAAANVSVVTVHAGNDDAAVFWEAMGYRPVLGHAWSHEKRHEA